MQSRALPAVILLVAVLSTSVCARNRGATREQAFARGNAAFAAQTYPAAVIEYRRALQLDPGFGEARLKLAQSYEQIGDLGRALAEYVKAVEAMPQRLEAQLGAGGLLLLVGRAPEAAEHAERALALAPNNVDARILKANATAGLRNLDDAVAQMYDTTESLSADPAQQARAFLHLSVMELARGHASDAEDVLRKAVAAQPDSVATRVAMASLYWVQGKYPAAEVELNRALAIDPNEPRANRALAALYVLTNRMDEAAKPLTMIAASGAPAARFLLADYFTVMKRNGDAEAILKPMTSDVAYYAQAQMRLALIEYGGGHVADAERRVDQTLKKEPTHPRVLLMKARFLAEARRFDEALAQIRAAMLVERQSPEAYYLLTTVHAARNDPAAAIQAFSELLKLRPRLVDAMLRLVSLNLDRGDRDAAVAFATQAVAAAPTRMDAHLALIRALLERGAAGQAENELKPLLALNPNSAIIATEWGRLLTLKDDLVGARRSFARAVELDPESIDAFGELVALDARTGRAAGIRPAVEERLAKSQRDGRLWLLAARVYGAEGQKDKLEAALLRVIEIEPGNLRAYGALGQYYYAGGRLGDARTQFERLAERQPRSVGAFTMLGMIQELEQKPEGAQAAYEHALALDPRAAVAANNLACLYVRRSGNLDVALSLAQVAAAEFPNEPEFSDTLGWTYVQKGLAPNGLEALLNSVRAQPENASFRYHLAKAYLAEGNVEFAREHLKKALRVAPDFDGASDAREELARLPKEKPAQR